MARLDRPEREPRSGRAKPWRQLRSIGGTGALIALGAALGGGTFLMLDTMNPSASHDSKFSLRGPYYHTCRDAFQDGRANMRPDEPGYRAELDADNDGIACEPFLRR